MSGAIDAMSETNQDTYKLLMIGSSFARDAASWLWDICHSAEVDIIVGIIDIGGCSLREHWENVHHGENAPFQKWDHTGVTHSFIPYKDVVSHDYWDI